MRLYNQDIHHQDTELAPAVKPPKLPEPFDWSTAFLLLCILCLILYIGIAVLFFVVYAPVWR